MSLPAAYAVLFASIVFEIVGTSALLASETFTKLVPSLVVAVCYALAMEELRIVVFPGDQNAKTIPAGESVVGGCAAFCARSRLSLLESFHMIHFTDPHV